MAKFKSLKIGDTVRVVSLADTGARCGDACLNKYIGGTFEVTSLQRQLSTGLGQVQLSNGWWFSPKGLEVLAPVGDACGAPTGDEHGEFVTPETPVGTTVVYIGGDGGTATPSGVTLELVRHDGDSRPRVEVIGSTDTQDYYYPNYQYLRVHNPEGSTTVTPTEPTPEPVELTTNDFKYTRVRVKNTGAEGVVVGRSRLGASIAVLHDKTSDLYHGGNTYEEGFVGVPDRIYYYPPDELEIIGGVQ